MTKIKRSLDVIKIFLNEKADEYKIIVKAISGAIRVNLCANIDIDKINTTLKDLCYHVGEHEYKNHLSLVDSCFVLDFRENEVVSSIDIFISYKHFNNDRAPLCSKLIANISLADPNCFLEISTIINNYSNLVGMLNGKIRYERV